LRNLAREADRCIASDEGSGHAPDDRVGIQVEKREGLGLVVKTGDETVLGLCATIFLDL
jgi:hypothetical protein